MSAAARFEMLRIGARVHERRDIGRADELRAPFLLVVSEAQLVARPNLGSSGEDGVSIDNLGSSGQDGACCNEFFDDCCRRRQWHDGRFRLVRAGPGREGGQCQ